MSTSSWTRVWIIYFSILVFQAHYGCRHLIFCLFSGYFLITMFNIIFPDSKSDKDPTFHNLGVKTKGGSGFVMIGHFKRHHTFLLLWSTVYATSVNYTQRAEAQQLEDIQGKVLKYFLYKIWSSLSKITELSSFTLICCLSWPRHSWKKYF